MMITKKITSIVFIIAIASMFVSSSVFVNSILAKTSTTTSSSKANMRILLNKNILDFQKCLSNAAGTKGFATQQEIKNCYNQIYNTSTVSTSSTAVGNGQ